ncbi:hypothetical protein F1559_005179 [Cyanidiococcus yangmingshanensis]|uniref:Uncharacterized protein n=1 Tax=Cyanidiococcus yangmingshanensis TaxID=2690220 RepID=A0A7J7INT1_9RHOD|nr:hypothetical protein F1559_005179 [Cyanidiococcus yangmingshanensis]
MHCASVRNSVLLGELLWHFSEGRPLWQQRALFLVGFCLAALLTTVCSLLNGFGGTRATRGFQLELAKFIVRVKKRAPVVHDLSRAKTSELFGGSVSPLFFCSCRACSGSNSFQRPCQRYQFEENRILRVRKLLGLQGLHAEAANKSQWCSDFTILRYIESFGDRLDVAAKQLAATIKWRIQESVHELSVPEFAKELETGVISFGGFDSCARPVFIVRFVHGFTLRLLIFMLEVAESILQSDRNAISPPKDIPNTSNVSSMWSRICRSIFGESKKLDINRDILHRNRWVWIVEWGRVSKKCRRQNCMQCVPVDEQNCYEDTVGGVSAAELVQAFRVCNEHYPNRLHTAYVLGAPRPVVSLFGIVAKRSTKRKIHFVRLKDGCDDGELGEYATMWRRPWSGTEFIQLIDRLDGSLSSCKVR